MFLIFNFFFKVSLMNTKSNQYIYFRSTWFDLKSNNISYEHWATVSYDTHTGIFSVDTKYNMQWHIYGGGGGKSRSEPPRSKKKNFNK